MKKNPCPLLSKYEADIDDPGEGIEANWVKDICIKYCPVEVCILDRKRRRIGKKERLIMESIEIPRMRGRMRICTKCNGQVLPDEYDDLRCVQCSKEYTKEIKDD